ncbi:MAG TPA: hypothetical protein VNA20_17215 [Frankiaceae bacterium]|nr:hypothetical protein [Frankiaceae bacterium]
MSAIEPGALLAHAAALAGGPGATGDPAVEFRRSVSGAYYAVFHAVALAVARRLAPASAADTHCRIARSVDHGRAAEVCRWLAEPGGGRRHVVAVVARLRANAALVELAERFGQLLTARQTADYDHLAEVGEEAAGEACASATRALALLEELGGSPDLDELLALVALNTPLR